jgi:hypothetical protein
MKSSMIRQLSAYAKAMATACGSGFGGLTDLIGKYGLPQIFHTALKKQVFLSSIFAK